MSTRPAAPRKTVAVTALGLLTLLLGGGYLAMGGALARAAAAMTHDPPDGWGNLLGVFAGLLLVLAVPLLLQGVLGLLAGWGVLTRKRWGRLLAFLLAGLAGLWGLAFLGVWGSDPDDGSIALGAVQLLYGVLAVAILVRRGAEFSRPRV